MFDASKAAKKQINAENRNLSQVSSSASAVALLVGSS